MAVPVDDPRAVPLRDATVPQLVEELVRRQNAEQVLEEPPEQWCDDCVHFQCATGKYEAERPRFNPCQKKHSMDFYVPQPHDSPETFGYFRLVCPDRTPRPPPVPPMPPAPPPAPHDGKPGWQKKARRVPRREGCPG
jgi:hypothetical protein